MSQGLIVESSNYSDLGENLYISAVVIGGLFALVAVALSAYLIFQHLKSYTKPEEQKWIVGILLMVPVYASDSIISLSYSRLSVVCEILRDCYEAFALYCFGRYLVACLGGEARVVELLESESEKQLGEPLMKEKSDGGQNKSSLYNFILHPGKLGEELYRIVKFGIVQYMILKTLCAVLAMVLEIFGVYGDGEFKWNYGYPYMAVVFNFSQMWALYCLVQFYNLTYQKLQSIKPLAKFISFKAIVFATWWQGVGIALLSSFGILPNQGKLENAMQDFLICIEMAIAAIAHVFVFSAGPYHFLAIPDYNEVTARMTESNSKVVNDEGKPGLVNEKKIKIQAPGTSITESVHDVIMTGGDHVVKDVVLTVNQAIKPVEKGVTKIRDKLHISAVKSKDVTSMVDLEEQVEDVLSDTG